MEVLEPIERKKYSKHKVTEKFSVAHYLNIQIVPIELENNLCYPLNVRIVKDRKNTTFRSIFWGYYSIGALEKNEKLINLLGYEKEMIALLFEEVNEQAISLTEFAKVYKTISDAVKKTVFNVVTNGFEDGFQEAFTNGFLPHFPYLKNSTRFEKKTLEYLKTLIKELWVSLDKDPIFCEQMNDIIKNIITKCLIDFNEKSIKATESILSTIRSYNNLVKKS